MLPRLCKVGGAGRTCKGCSVRNMRAERAMEELLAEEAQDKAKADKKDKGKAKKKEKKAKKEKKKPEPVQAQYESDRDANTENVSVRFLHASTPLRAWHELPGLTIVPMATAQALQPG